MQLSVPHGDEMIGITGCEIEIVQHHHDRGSPPGVEVDQQIEHLEHAVVFIDEVEEIAATRRGDPPSATQGVTNELLKLVAEFRDREGRLSNGYGGGYAYRDYRTGKTLTNAREHGDVARQAPARVQSRTTVVSRGGFGGGGRAYGG